MKIKVFIALIISAIIFTLTTICKTVDKSVDEPIDEPVKEESIEKYLTLDSTTYEYLTIRTFIIPKGYQVEFVDSAMPTDSNTILCVAAAFTHKDYAKYDTFDPILVANDYVTKGVYKKGYKCSVSMTGGFANINGEHSFFKGKNNNLLKEAQNNNGSYFQQNLAIYNGEIQMKTPFSKNKGFKQPYRFLCELSNGDLAIVEVRGVPYKAAVIQALNKPICRTDNSITIKHALYLDMGGWSDGWYRDSRYIYDINTDNKIDKIYQNNHQTNWIVVTKK
jgi:hypothetical protein